jgi:outer membrane protein assembly factor BamB
MILGDYLYMVEENSLPHCYELATGKEVWEVTNRPGGTTWGSMLHAQGKLFIPLRNAETLVLAASPKYEVLGTNSLGSGQQTNSSLAISHGEIYFRTFNHLWCIGEK